MTRAKDIGTRLRVGNGAPSTAFEKGHDRPGPGRPRGSTDRLSREIKVALLDAGEYTGECFAREDAEARKAAGLPPEEAPLRGLAAYLGRISRTHPVAYTALLSKVLPSQIVAEAVVQEPSYKSLEEVADRLRSLGLEPARIYQSYPMLQAKPDDGTESR
jgi:hypothetical protein